jgi:hypothetical protein
MRFLGFYYTLIYVIGLSILITIVLLLIRFYLPALKKILTNLNNKELQIEDNSMLRSIANEQPQKDIFELMIQNMDEIRGYFEISKSQASKAFIFSVISAVIGLIFFGVSVIIGFKDEKIDTAVIGAIAGGITEIVSIFALHIYNKTLVQLNHYHEALHKNERYLSTVHLVSKLSSERQDDTYLEIIRSSLNAKEYNEKTIINDV